MITPNSEKYIPNIDSAIQACSIFEALSGCSRLYEIVQGFANHVEKHIVVKTLGFTDGNKSMAAGLLKINYKTRCYKMTLCLI
jgi:DNA-binding protein Fis